MGRFAVTVKPAPGADLRVSVRYNYNLAGAEETGPVASRMKESFESPEDHHREDEQAEDHLRNEEPLRQSDAAGR